MREIKFRWWNGSRMVQNENLCVLAKNLKNGKDGEYMQFTGLKDCNGVEIYEGDIVSGLVLICVVAWGRSGWIARWKDKWGMSGSPNLGFRSHEVIGNIHENPELLGGEG